MVIINKEKVKEKFSKKGFGGFKRFLFIDDFLSVNRHWQANASYDDGVETINVKGFFDSPHHFLHSIKDEGINFDDEETLVVYDCNGFGITLAQEFAQGYNMSYINIDTLHYNNNLYKKYIIKNMFLPATSNGMAKKSED